MKNHEDSVLMIFAKFPDLGKVKTRLADDIGFENATSIYKLMTEYIVKESYSKEYRQVIYVSPPSKEKKFGTWLGNKEFSVQSMGDLGERLANAFKKEFDAGADKVVVIGTDCVECDKAEINYALELLNYNDAVIGPSYDGGYYLLGLKKTHGSIFENVSWSGLQVYDQTCNNLERLGYSYSVLPYARDIDTIEDVQILQECDHSTKGLKKLCKEINVCMRNNTASLLD